MILKLNFDVLTLVLKICPTATLTSLSLVSSYLCLAVMPHLLHTVCLDRDFEQLVGFLNFIIKYSKEVVLDQRGGSPAIEVRGAGCYVRALEIEDLAYDPDPRAKAGRTPGEEELDSVKIWAPLFTRAITLMPNVHSFSIRLDLQDLLTYSPAFSSTLLTRPHLYRLELWDIGMIADASFGETMRSGFKATRLRSILVYSADDIDRLKLRKEDGMGSVLWRHGESLETIHLKGIGLHEFLTHGTPSSSGNGDSVVFPKVTTLFLSECDVFIKTLALSFPNLQALELDFEPFSDEYTADVASYDVEAYFPNLTSIKGKFKDVSTLIHSTKFCDKLRRIVLKPLWSSNIIEDPTTAISARAVPGLRSLHVYHTDSQSLIWWQKLAPSLGPLAYLSVSFQSSALDDLEVPFQEVPWLLSSIALEYVSVFISGGSHRIGYLARSEARAMAEECAVALSYASSIRSLKYIDVTKQVDLDKGPTRWWKIIRTKTPQAASSASESHVLLDELAVVEGTVLRAWHDKDA